MNESIIRSEIERGVAQVDDSLEITEFSVDLDKTTRKQKVFFTVRTQDGETMEVSDEWG